MGRAKALLEVQGKPILEHLLDQLDWPGPTLLITAPGREVPPGSDRFDREVSDAVAGQGPLRGVLTALEHVETDSVVIVAVDMPAVRCDDLKWFVMELAARPELVGLMALRGKSIEPLPCAFRRSAKELVSQHLATGRHSLHGLATDARVAALDARTLPGRIWLNVNTPEDWKRFVQTLEH
jgi:molybdopterin-guanine dinucleotide biosynthesis protein A